MSPGFDGTPEPRTVILDMRSATRYYLAGGVGKGGEVRSYLCSMAMASLVLTWSRPKVSEKRRASSLMPQNDEEERSKP